MKIACLFLVVLVAAFARGDISTLSVKEEGVAGVLVLSGFASEGLVCADNGGGEGVAKVACSSGSFQKVESSAIPEHTYEWRMTLDCSGSEGSVDECTKKDGPEGLNGCGSFVGCAKAKREFW